MKTSSLKGILFTTFLLAFAVGCGKESGGGGGNNNYGGSNNLINQPTENIDSQAIAGYNQLVNWKNAIVKDVRNERAPLRYGIGYSKGIFDLTSNNQVQVPSGCKAIEVWGKVIGYYCSGSNQQQPAAATPLSVTERRCLAYSVGTNGVPQLKYKAATELTSTRCTPTGAEVVYSIGKNTELNSILAFQKGKIYNVTTTGNGIFRVFVGPKTGGYVGSATELYVIDTTIHSVYSPVASQSLSDTTKAMQLYEAF